MHINLTNAGVTFPDFWNEDKVVNAFLTLDTYDLYKYFGCSNSTSFTRLMKPHFPNRPEKTSYSKYVRDLVADTKTDSTTSSITKTDTLTKTVSEPRTEEFYYLNLFTTEGQAWYTKLNMEERRAFKARKLAYETNKLKETQNAV